MTNPTPVPPAPADATLGDELIAWAADEAKTTYWDDRESSQTCIFCNHITYSDKVVHKPDCLHLRAVAYQANRARIRELEAENERYSERITELTKQCDDIYRAGQSSDRVLRDIRYAMHLDVGFSLVEQAEFLYMHRQNSEAKEKKLINLVQALDDYINFELVTGLDERWEIVLSRLEEARPKATQP